MITEWWKMCCEHYQPEERRPRNITGMQCFDRFAIAKKRHADNLRHQVLPDKVDDSVFRDRASKNFCGCGGRRGRVQCRHDERKDFDRYGPELGCKTPKTKMDLAICWETPVNAAYDPTDARGRRIDVGRAPAVFQYVKRTTSTDLCAYYDEENAGNDLEKRYNCNCGEEQNCDQCLWKNMGNLNIKEKNERIRKCAACDGSKRVRVRSVPPSRNPSVPRPRTPYARRSFRIDTLSAPFNLSNGTRDADYPEHWRLMTIYQQSYRNPRKLRYSLQR